MEKKEIIMTRLIPKRIECPYCGTLKIYIVTLSICSWLDPKKVEDLYYGKLNEFHCKNYKKIFQIYGNVLINARKGMITINSGHSLNKIRASLKNVGLIDSEGNIINEFKSLFKLSFLKKSKKIKKNKLHTPLQFLNFIKIKKSNRLIFRSIPKLYILNHLIFFSRSSSFEEIQCDENGGNIKNV